MSQERTRNHGRMIWGIGASVLLHLLVVAAFLVRLPFPAAEAQKEETVQVELVPPPEPQQPPAPEKPKEPEKPELKLPDMMKPEEAKKEEPPPPPPPPEPARPEPPKPEEAKKQDAPPEPQQAPQQAPPTAAGQGKSQPLEVLRPVVEFGEKDSGPRKALDGDAAQDQGPNPGEKPSPEQPVEHPPSPSDKAAETTDDKPAEPEESPSEDAPPPPQPAESEAAAVADGIALPEISDPAAPQGEGGPKEASPDAVRGALVTAKSRPGPETEPAKPKAEADLPEVKRLFSVTDTGEAVARTAIRGIPRDIRASQLCSTELKEQLRHGTPGYQPELLPSYRLPSGTVMEVRRGAFRADAQWYDLSFRCELDEGVTKVVSFAFKVGDPVPQSQWRKRGFPEF